MGNIRIFIFSSFVSGNRKSYQTNSGSINWMTITKPNVTNIRPKFSSNIRQHTPFTFGQNGFGADISSI